MCSVRICTAPPLFTASKLFLEPHCWRNAILSIIVHGKVILINTVMPIHTTVYMQVNRVKPLLKAMLKFSCCKSVGRYESVGRYGLHCSL